MPIEQDNITIAPSRHMSASGDDTGEHAGPRKRQRTSMACDSCRNRKSRCDGGRPSCSSCIETGSMCTYRHPVVTSAHDPPASSYLAHLDSRLQALDSIIRAFASNTANAGAFANPAITPPTSHNVIGQHTSKDSSINIDETAHHVSGDHNQRLLPPAPPSPKAQAQDTVDGMASITFAGEARSAFFGASSNSTLLACILRALTPANPSTSPADASVRSLASGISPPASPALGPTAYLDPRRDVDPYFLPPILEIIRLVDGYFSVSGRLFPMIRKSSVLDPVLGLGSASPKLLRKSYLCLLNAIMALGSSVVTYDGQIVDRDDEHGSVFFQRAVDLSPWINSDTVSLETVQALATMVMHLQGTSQSTRTWRLHGNLVQAAIQEGLHTEEEQTMISPLERELRRRTWYMCVILDTTLSATLGRPAMINEGIFPVPLPHNVDIDGSLGTTGELPPSINSYPTYSLLFIETIKLHRISGDIIRNLYNHNTARSISAPFGDLLTKLLELEQSLHDWKLQLPASITLISGAESGPASFRTRPQVVLTLRFLMVQLQLYRVLLLRSLSSAQNPSSNPLGNPAAFLDIQNTYVRHCAQCAREILEVTASVCQLPDLSPSWWFTLYYTFTAALHLFGIIVVSTFERRIVDGLDWDLNSCLREALNTLHHAGKGTRNARRSSKYLGAIVQVADVLGTSGTPSKTHWRKENEPLHTLFNDGVFASFDPSFGQLFNDAELGVLDNWNQGV